MRDTTSEPDLIAQARAGNIDAQDALMRRHLPALVAYARMGMGDVLRHHNDQRRRLAAKGKRSTVDSLAASPPSSRPTPSCAGTGS